MTMKLLDANHGELMSVTALDRDGNELLIKGTIYGTMPMTARLRPEEARKVFGLLNVRIFLFLLSMMFRRP